MDFSESDRVQGFRQTVREFMKKEVYPLEQKLRHDGFKALLPTLREKRAKAKETGLWAAHIPAEWGGAGLSFTAVVAIHTGFEPANSGSVMLKQLRMSPRT
ncbi:MAG TPA: acyl-CoA dehydrogenase family protein, partial [Myxococcales bacterium]|nr:acyl-CoA dehydrogenase family protein [Myxococcales bacterium]